MRFEPEQSDSNSQLLKRFFTGLSEYAFYSHLGCTDMEMVDYISDLLVRFTKTESLHRIQRWNGMRATEVVALMVEAQLQCGTVKREIHRHIGDFTLFWTGLYPESIKSVPSNKADRFVSFCTEGKRAYEIASITQGDVESEVVPTNDLLHRLSEQFELCAQGLREIRRQWEEPTGGSGSLFV